MFTVMLVDDCDIMRVDVKRLRLWGEASGFVISAEAGDGQEALDKLRQQPMDVVITDIRMPKMGGIELLRCISEENLAQATVLLSDFTEYAYARQGMLYGAFDYIGKPVNGEKLAELLERIRKNLETKLQAEMRLSDLQGVVNEIMLTAGNIDLIVEKIGRGDAGSPDLTASLVEKVAMALNGDIARASLVLKTAWNGIIAKTLEKHAWLSAFADASEWKRDVIGCGDWAEIKAVLGAGERSLTAYMDRFMGHHGNELVNRACLYILEHIEEDVSVKGLTEKLFISKSYLSDLFKDKMGISLLQYITTAKVARAKRIICETNLKSYEIAYKLGFQDNEYFSKVFKKHTGLSLTEFRQNQAI
ncbi:response regulator [Gorillibacterium massiliense]|uniref:response regulator n=1 Tax=Gorillibacterium massiliense TaxID=1280390 RepID=UPI0004BA7C30|nr:response regulator [Gorillibacterium massiliense]